MYYVTSIYYPYTVPIWTPTNFSWCKKYDTPI